MTINLHPPKDIQIVLRKKKNRAEKTTGTFFGQIVWSPITIDIADFSKQRRKEGKRTKVSPEFLRSGGSRQVPEAMPDPVHPLSLGCPNAK